MFSFKVHSNLSLEFLLILKSAIKKQKKKRETLCNSLASKYYHLTYAAKKEEKNLTHLFHK